MQASEEVSFENLEALAFVEKSEQALLLKVLSKEELRFARSADDIGKDSSPLYIVDVDTFPEVFSSLMAVKANSQHALLLIGEKFSDKVGESFSRGFVDFIQKPVEAFELNARVRSLWMHRKTDMIRAKREEDLYEMALLLKELNKELDRLSHYDALTNLPNRRLFLEVLEKEWRRSLRDKSPISILMMDIDHFKNFNDTFGHLEGDEVLQRIADCLQKSLRRPGDMVARWGGEEFVGVLPNTDAKGALIVAESMRQAVANLKVENPIGKKKNFISISLGVVSELPRSSEKFMDAVDRADAKLYEAKSKGRNQVLA